MQKIEPPLISNLLKLANAWAAHQGCSLANVGRRIHGDTDAFRKLEAGRGSITLRKYDETMAKFWNEWPEGLKWPKLREPFKGAKDESR